ncbi:hypothetical protein F0Q45_27075, partial [Mycobacterium simiae]
MSSRRVIFVDPEIWMHNNRTDKETHNMTANDSPPNVDRMAMALTAVELINGATTHTDEEVVALLDGHSLYEMHVLLSSTVWCAYFLAG